MAICGAITAAIAHGRGRNAAGWFVIGFLTFCIGIILVLVLPDLNLERQREADARDAWRRQREPIAPEGRHGYAQPAAAPYDAPDPQDAPLGADGFVQPLAGHAAQEARFGRPGAEPDPEPQGSMVKEWFYERGGESRGPVSEAAIRIGLQKGKIDGTTLVWREGMANWQALMEVPVFDGRSGRDPV